MGDSEPRNIDAFFGKSKKIFPQTRLSSQDHRSEDKPEKRGFIKNMFNALALLMMDSKQIANRR